MTGPPELPRAPPRGAFCCGEGSGRDGVKKVPPMRFTTGLAVGLDVEVPSYR